jgi:hypothetical protein
VTKPKRQGFGSVILFESAKQFRMDVSVDYDPKGLRYELRVPMRDIAPSKPSDAAAGTPAPANQA